MLRPRMFLSALLIVCLGVALATAAPPGRGGARPGGGKPPGGAWSEKSHQHGMPGEQRPGGGPVAGANQRPREPQASPFHHEAPGQGAPGAAAAGGLNRNVPGAGGQGLGKPGLPGEGTVGNRFQPQATGAQGAAAGAAAVNRNNPQATGAQGAAAGAAAANRNNPQATGAQGAAVGAAAANRNQPNFSGAQGAAAGAAVANRNNPAVSGAAGAAMGATAVRNSYSNYGLYNAQWYGANTAAWSPARWAAGGAWTAANWATAGAYIGAAAAPVSYNYGVNVTSQDGNVVVNGQSVGTVADYSQQAATLAQTGAEADATAGDFLPLGVFAMVRDEQQHPQFTLQLAINKQGILRGNFYDEHSQSTTPIHGAVDPQTQRAAWLVGSNTTSVMEAGLSNLVAGEAPALIHKSGTTDHWLLVRLEQPAANAQ